MSPAPRLEVHDGWSLHGIDTVIVDNGVLRLVLMPRLGGKVWQLTHLATGRDLLWHHPRMRPAAAPRGAVYDDAFVGGIDELFPNDLPETLAGEELPDHGELWTTAFDHEVHRSADEVVVHQWTSTITYPCRSDTWITVRPADPRVTVRRRITNQGPRQLPYLWKLHAAAALSPGARVDLPATTMLAEQLPTQTSGPARGAGGPARYTWPMRPGPGGELHDLRTVPPAGSALSEFQYATSLTAGWCAISHPEDGAALTVAFDRSVFSSCWTFASYGGWRGLEVVVLEPCTGWPVSVTAGITAGTHRVLTAREVIDTTVVLTAASGAHLGVSGVDPDGTVHPVRE